MNEVPYHVAIIMDGNGRWAKKRGLPRLAGHRKGIEVLDRVVDAAIDIGIKVVSVYSFSKENWKRPKDEVNGLWRLMEEYIEKRAKRFIEKDVKLMISGDLEELPSSLVEKVLKLIDETKNNATITLNVCLNYSGRYEILRAAFLMLKDRMKSGDDSFPSEEEFAGYLWTKDLPDPDLLIRTSGELRISNFLLWQLAYTEFYFTDVLWPDFTEDDLYKAVEEYKKRERRFGGI